VSMGSRDFHNQSQLEQEKAVGEVHLFIKDHKGKSVMVFTYGSVYDGAVGCGACAAVLVPLLGDDAKHSSVKAIGKKVSAVTCELEGIILGLELALEYYLIISSTRQPKESLYILCDCSVAIDAMMYKLAPIRQGDIFQRLCYVEDGLANINVDIILSWIPGHQGIDFNDTADRLAKVTAYDIYTGRLFAPVSVSYNDAVKLSQDIVRKSWQTKWNQDATGFYTRHLIPEVGTKDTFPEYHTVVYFFMTRC